MDSAQFDEGPVTLKELRKLASDGLLRRKRRRSKYREILVSFKTSEQPAWQVKGLTYSQVSQLVSSIPTVFGTEKITTKTLNKVGEGTDAKLDVLLIRTNDETKVVLSTAKVYSGSRGQVTAAKSETIQDAIR